MTFDTKTLWGNVEIGLAQGLGFALIYVLIVHVIGPKVFK
jgi:hypothetical protein